MGANTINYIQEIRKQSTYLQKEKKNSQKNRKRGWNLNLYQKLIISLWQKALATVGWPQGITSKTL